MASISPSINNPCNIPFHHDILNTEMDNSERFGPGKFRFRGLHPNIHIGMASDRYAGWIGQVYSEGRYTKEIKPRTHKIGEKSFTEEVLPVESVEEYFESQWGKFFIVDKPYKNMLKPRNGKTASGEKGVFRQMGMELHYRVGGLRGREIGELFRAGDRSVSQE